MAMASKAQYSENRGLEQLKTSKARFEANMHRHEKLKWASIEARLQAAPEKLPSLVQMEESGGEPDVIAYDKSSDQFLIVDCSAESPKARRSLCYDQEALASRKEHKPKGSAVGMARDMGLELLTEDQYRILQDLGEFDVKTSSWVLTPPEIRALGGAIFGDRRFGRVFIYHNGAESYYGARGFRSVLKI